MDVLPLLKHAFVCLLLLWALVQLDALLVPLDVKVEVNGKDGLLEGDGCVELRVQTNVLKVQQYFKRIFVQRGREAFNELVLVVLDAFEYLLNVVLCDQGIGVDASDSLLGLCG